MSPDDFREIVLALDGAVEGAHMKHPDFRANGRIFASLHSDDRFGMVKLTPEEQAVLRHRHLVSYVLSSVEFMSADRDEAQLVSVPPYHVAGTSTVLSCIFSGRRLSYLAAQPEPWWTVRVPFFDVERERIWIVWRRILHTAHHRTQLSVCLRLLDRPVPPTYGPTADASWDGADPTTTVDAAARR